MSTITHPIPGSRFGGGVTAGGVVGVSNGTYPLGEHTRWQFNLTGAESTGNAGSNLQLQAIADDGSTIIATSMSVARSTGIVTLLAGSTIVTSVADGSVSAPSVFPASNTGSGLYFTTNAVNVAANGVRVVDFATVGTGVNYFLMTPAATGGNVALTATGSDTDVGLILGSKGAGVVSLGGTTVANGSLHAVTVASSVDYLSVSGTTTGNHVVLVAAAGTDTNVSLSIQGKGAGPTLLGVNTTSNVIVGTNAALANSATAGLLLIPTTSGTPSGAPVGHGAGNAAVIADTSGSFKLFVYFEGTGWKSVALS